MTFVKHGRPDGFTRRGRPVTVSSWLRKFSEPKGSPSFVARLRRSHSVVGLTAARAVFQSK